MRPPPTPRSLAGLERPPISRSLIREVSQALIDLIREAAQLKDWDVLTQAAAFREAVYSSQIEGTRSNIDHLLEYEITRTPEEKPSDVALTHNYVEALKIGLTALRSGGRSTLTLDLLHQLHAKLMEGALPTGQLGRYRDRQVWIGSSPKIEHASYVPPPSEQLPELMEELQSSMLDYQLRGEDMAELPILLQLAFAHAQFEAIHPYIDGNGRTGRLLMPLMLTGSGYPPLYLSNYLHSNRQDYYSALQQAALGQTWTPWVEMMSEAVLESIAETKALVHNLQSLHREWLDRMGKVRQHAVLGKIAYGLLSNPYVTTNFAMKAHGVTFRAANLAIDQLVGAGILIEKTGRQRGRVFHAPQVTEILSK